MAKKEFKYKGNSEEDLKNMSISQYAEIIPSRLRRKVKRGFTDAEKALLKKVEKNESNIETHCRDMIILPIMFGKTIKVHNGKEFVPVDVNFEMAGHVLGEFALTRKFSAHSGPGVGATKSSSALSVR
ncbi:30S ribosomal protein S19 [Candidatus Woesearchaeota archaeon]|nr:30S ribosomal protein S19 [Candidatus Woesearchaeota archaeon]